MRVLVVEDDGATAKSMELMLLAEGFNVYVVGMGEEGIDLAKNYDYDLITLDLNLPDMSGYEVLRTLRNSNVRTPVIIVSGTDAVDAKVKAFGLGADDYVTKPFHRDELVARLQAVVRRARGFAQSVVTVGQVSVDLTNKEVSVGENRIHLTGKEFSMIELMALRRGVTITKEMFLNHLYGGIDEPELKIVDVFMCKLRRKLSLACNGENYIETIWGRGYVFRDQKAPSPADCMKAPRIESPSIAPAA